MEGEDVNGIGDSDDIIVIENGKLRKLIVMEGAVSDIGVGSGDGNSGRSGNFVMVMVMGIGEVWWWWE